MKACCLTDFTPTFSRELKMCDWSKLISDNFNESQKVKIDKRQKNKII